MGCCNTARPAADNSMGDKKIHLEKNKTKQKIAKAFSVLKAGALQHGLRSISGSSGLVLAAPPLALQRL